MIMNDSLFLQMRFSEILSSVVRDSVLVISSLTALIFINPKMAGLILLLAPPILFFYGSLGEKNC